MTVELSVDERRKIIEENSWSLTRPEEEPPDTDHRVYTEGQGIYLRDSEATEYIDATSGNWCTILGHGNRKVIKVIEEQHCTVCCEIDVLGLSPELVLWIARERC